MSAGSSRPPVPRPSPRKSSAPPPPPAPEAKGAKEPEAKTPSSPVLEIPKAYKSAPPVIRDRAPSAVELADEDLSILEEPPPRRRSTPPPPPPARPRLVISSTPVVVVPAPIAKAAPPINAPLPLPLPAGITAPIPGPAPLPILQPVSEIKPIDERPRSTVEPPPESRVRVKKESVLDPMDVLFDGMYELNFVDTAVEAADVCAAALAKALRARAVVIHAHDLVHRQLRAIGVHGMSPSEVLFTAEPSEDDLIASAVICNQAPVTMKFDGELPRLAPRRLALAGAPRTLVAVPALAWGRCVAMIEVIDAADDVAARVADSAAYVAERLAEFLSERAAA